MVNNKNNYNNSILLAVIILIFIFYTPLFKINLSKGVFCLQEPKNICEISGILISTPIKQSDNKFYKAKIHLKQETSKSNIKSTCSGQIEVFIPVLFVESLFPGKLYSSSKSTKNCLFEQGGTYFFRGRMAKKGFIVTDCINNYWDNTFSGKVSYLRALLRLQFKRLMFSWGKAGGLLLALLSGAKEYTDIKISEAFKLSGLSHILALSGMHLSMFSGLAMFIGKKAKRKKLSFIIRIIALLIFVWFAGFSPSLLRAYICAMLLLFATMAGYPDPDMLLILCFSFIFQIIISPEDIHNTGFILSYSALAGILIFNKSVKKFLMRFLNNYFSSSLASSTSAQIFTIPINLSLFGCYSPIGIIATCFVSPLITVFIYSGLILIVLSLIFPYAASVSAFFMNFLYTIIEKFVYCFSKFPCWRIN